MVRCCYSSRGFNQSLSLFTSCTGSHHYSPHVLGHITIHLMYWVTSLFTSYTGSHHYSPHVLGHITIHLMYWVTSLFTSCTGSHHYSPHVLGHITIHLMYWVTSLFTSCTGSHHYSPHVLGHITIHLMYWVTFLCCSGHLHLQVNQIIPPSHLCIVICKQLNLPFLLLQIPLYFRLFPSPFNPKAPPQPHLSHSLVPNHQQVCLD